MWNIILIRVFVVNEFSLNLPLPTPSAMLCVKNKGSKTTLGREEHSEWDQGLNGSGNELSRRFPIKWTLEVTDLLISASWWDAGETLGLCADHFCPLLSYYHLLLVICLTTP